ncbi:MAG: hypothetical protein ISN28_05500 [Ectothiorhodospiraceae bacterium AqS1]|nr:hypothetical protein [Ectothiorhodospiraceae bacterium AqS1]
MVSGSDLRSFIALLAFSLFVASSATCVHAAEAGLDTEVEKGKIIVTDIDGNPITPNPGATTTYNEFSHPPNFIVDEGGEFKIRVKLSGPHTDTPGRDRGRMRIVLDSGIGSDKADINFYPSPSRVDYWDNYQTITISSSNDVDQTDTASSIKLEPYLGWTGSTKPDPVVFWVRQRDNDSALTFHETQSGGSAYDASNPLQINEGENKTVYVQISGNPTVRMNFDIQTDGAITANHRYIAFDSTNFRNRQSLILTAAVDNNDSDEKRTVTLANPAPSSTDKHENRRGYGFRTSADLPIIVREPVPDGEKHKSTPNFLPPLTIEEGKVVNIGFKYPSGTQATFIFARSSDTNRIRIGKATGPNDISLSSGFTNNNIIGFFAGAGATLQNIYIKIHAVDNDKAGTGASATIEFAEDSNSWTASSYIDNIGVRIAADG